MSHPDGLPDLFLDRSLGRVRVPALLRAAGLRLVTLSERYGIPSDENIPDYRWLADAGECGETVFNESSLIADPSQVPEAFLERVRQRTLNRIGDTEPRRQ